MSRFTRIAGWIAIGVLGGIALAFLAIQVLTNTGFGMERARRFAVGWLADEVNGELRIGRVAGRGLLGGATLHDVSIRGPDGRPFLIADSATAVYDWRSLVRGRIVLDEVRLYAPRIYVEKLPGDTLWNYERIFADTAAGASTGARRLILIQGAQIVNGNAIVRREWTPQAVVQAADTARLNLEEVPGGVAEVWRFTNLNGSLDRVIWESPIEEGKLFQVNDLSGRAFIWRDPIELRDVRGTLTLVDSVVAFDLTDVRLPTSRASVFGQVVLGTEGNRYDVRIETPEVHFSDLRWLNPTMPEDGAGSMVLHIQSQQPKGILFLAENARITGPGTQLTGTLGVVAGDTLYFTDVDLRASPLDTRFLENLLPGKLPVEGLLVGTVEVRGPISALETSGDVHVSSGTGTGSGLRWNGVLDARGGARGVSARRLTADVTRLDLALLSAFRPGIPLTGSLAGRVNASGRVDGEMRVDGTLRHQAAGRPASEFQGGGTLRFAGDVPVFDLRFNATPLALDEIAALSPSLAGLHGEARGTVHLSGPANRLLVTADLTTEAGGIAFESRISQGTLTGAYAATGRVSGFRPRVLSDRFPDALVSGQFTFDLEGGDLAGVRGPFRFDLDSARVSGLPIERGTFSGALEDGLLRVDTLTAAAAGMLLMASGEFGLIEGRAGTVDIALQSSSLEPLEPIFFDDEIDPTSPRVAGTARLRGTISGTISQFDLEANGATENLLWDRATLRSGTFALTGARTPEDVNLSLLAYADSVLVAGRRADSVRVSVEHAAGATRIDGGAWLDEQSLVAVTGSGRKQETQMAIEIERLQLGSGNTAWSLLEPTRLELGALGITVEPAVLHRADERGELRAVGSLAWARAGDPEPYAQHTALDFMVDANNIPFADALGLVRSQPDAAGVMNGSVRVTGAPHAPEIRGELRIEDLRYENAHLDQVGARFDYDSARVATRLDGFYRGRRVLFAEGRVPIDLRFTAGAERRRDDPLDFTLQADSLPAALAIAFIDGFRDIEGLIDGTVTASGTTREPELRGALTVRRGAATADATGVRYQNVIGTMLIDTGRVVNVDLSARATDPRTRDGGGAARVSGSVRLAQLADPGLDLTLETDRLLAARRRDMDLTVSGRMSVAGRYQRPLLSGNLRVDHGTLYIDELYRRYLIIALEDPLLFEVVDTSLVSVRRVLPETENPFMKNLRVENLSVTVGSGSWLRSREMNVEVAGNLTVDFDRQREDLRLNGALNVVRGTYRFDYRPFARIFEVRSGVVEFPGTPGMDPNLDITAAYKARTQSEPLEIEARLTGTLQSPRVRLTSDAEPPISESDLASYLLFGSPTHAFNIGAGSGPDGGDDSGGIGRSTLGAAFVNAYGFGYIAGGLQTIAQNFGLDVGLTAGQGIGGIFETTELELGRYLSPRTYIAYTAPLGRPNQLAGFRLEWRFHPTYNVELFAEDRFARSPIWGLNTALEPRKVYGFFLFREWGY